MSEPRCSFCGAYEGQPHGKRCSHEQFGGAYYTEFEADVKAERDRYRQALEEIADASRVEDADPLEWAVWAHDRARAALGFRGTTSAA